MDDKQKLIIPMFLILKMGNGDQDEAYYFNGIEKFYICCTCMV